MWPKEADPLVPSVPSTSAMSFLILLYLNHFKIIINNKEIMNKKIQVSYITLLLRVHCLVEHAVKHLSEIK